VIPRERVGVRAAEPPREVERELLPALRCEGGPLVEPALDQLDVLALEPRGPCARGAARPRGGHDERAGREIPDALAARRRQHHEEAGAVEDRQEVDHA